MKGGIFMRLNICMLGPSGAGKTSMMTAIFMDARRKLVTHPSQIKIYPDSEETTQKIQAAISQFEWTLRLESSEVAVLPGNAAMSEYKFRFHIPNSPQPIDVNILDYPGGWLGTENFQLVEQHVQDSLATLVPIPADLLLEWYRNSKINPNEDIYKYVTEVLQPDDVCAAIKNWVDHRCSRAKKSLLMFVPIRCEHCFADNCCNGNLGRELQEAVEQMYISRLDFSDEQKANIKTIIHAVDTYGVVELENVTWNANAQRPHLLSKFRRVEQAPRAKTKGAYEILSAIIHFKMKEYADRLNTSIGDIEQTISQRGIFKKVLVAIFGDKEKAKLNALSAEEIAILSSMEVLSDVANECDAVRTREIN